jgi:hypothetical protein
MVDMIMNTIRELVTGELPIWFVHKNGFQYLEIKAANINIAKRTYAIAIGLKTTRGISAKKVDNA